MNQAVASNPEDPEDPQDNQIDAQTRLAKANRAQAHLMVSTIYELAYKVLDKSQQATPLAKTRYIVAETHNQAVEQLVQQFRELPRYNLVSIECNELVRFNQLEGFALQELLNQFQGMPGGLWASAREEGETSVDPHGPQEDDAEG